MILSVRVGIIIGLLSIVISTIVAGASYYYQLERATLQSQQLVEQLAENANRTSAIAAYLNDDELANEIVTGLANNDLIAGAIIVVTDANSKIQAGTVVSNVNSIVVNLRDPFIGEELLGTLEVFPDLTFIQNQASSNSLQNALLLILLSVLIALFVSLYVRKELTRPLRSLSTEFSLIDTTAPDEMQAIKIPYKRKDEIGSLVSNINKLILALQKQFRSERELRRTTEVLQKRYRLIFEQATAGLAVLSSEGVVSIANPAFNQLFGENTEGKELAQYFDSASEFTKQLKDLKVENSYAQIEIDLVSYQGEKKRHLHCLFSTIHDERATPRENTDHLVEAIIYDITQRKELESKTRYEADHDSLTNLMNRRSGTTKLEQQLSDLVGSEAVFGLMMMDLDKFKPINDTHGHDVGDLVLKTISERIKLASEKYDTTAIRWGGDEFLIGIRADEPAMIVQYAQRVLSSVQQEIRVNEDLSVAVGGSIGIVTIAADKADGATIADMINQSDNLMYQVKQSNKNSFTVVEYQV